MTIQIPNPGTGVPADQSGDSPWLAMTKVAENFSNQTHAASRLVGIAAGNVMEAGAFGIGGTTLNLANQGDLRNEDLTDASKIYNKGLRFGLTNASQVGLSGSFAQTLLLGGFSANGSQPTMLLFQNKQIYIRAVNAGLDTAWVAPIKIISSANTTVDSNGFIKSASPVVKVHADRIELNDDAKQQDITFTKNAIGDYTITTVSGLSTDGWYIELPKDLNGNPKIAITLSETDGVISLKCYKRIFSMETFNFIPDLDTPLDIPEGRWIDLRLNELPKEPPVMPTEIQPEV